MRDSIENDPRVLQAKALLLEVLKDKQQAITKICPPDSALQTDYEKIIKSFGEKRGFPLWFPYVGSGIGNGSLVQLLDGSIKYDFISGIGAHHFGHNHPALLEAGIEAALSDLVVQGNLQQNLDQIELSDLLIEESGLKHCFLSTSGSMANENGFKIALQKKYPAHRILAFERGFSGRTLAMAQVTDKPQIRQGLPSTLTVDYIPFFDAESPEKSIQRSVSTLKKFLSRYPKEYALMLFEMVQGEGGFYPGSFEFFHALIEVLKENQIAIMVDEVQTFGRTPSLFAFHHFNLKGLVDIVSIGKLPFVCATLYTAEYNPRPGLLSQTFTSSTHAIRAGKKIIEMLIEGDFFGPEGKNVQVHRQFVNHLENIRKRHPHLVKGPYGLGGMIAFTPLDGKEETVIRFIKNLFHNGVMVFICGKDPTRARFLPPIGVVTNEDITQAAALIEQTLIQTIGI